MLNFTARRRCFSIVCLLPADNQIICGVYVQARSVRDNAQTGALTDTERRQRAAAMASRFAEMMLPPGEFESSSDEEGEGEGGQ